MLRRTRRVAVLRPYLAPFPAVPPCHQDPSNQLLSVAIAAGLEQVGRRLHQRRLVQLDAEGPVAKRSTPGAGSLLATR